MKKTSVRRPRQQPLANGQVWRMAEADLLVTSVGKMLVHYKLGKKDAPRIANSISSIKNVEKFLKDKKAVVV